MNGALAELSRLATARPRATFGALLIITIVLAAGVALRAPLAETEGFFPPDSPILQATERIDEQFQSSGKVSTTTLLFRGDALTPAGLAQMDALIERILALDETQPLLPSAPDADAGSAVSPALLIRNALGVGEFQSISQSQIDQAAAEPELQAALSAMTGLDADGGPIAIATIRLRDTGDDQLRQAERMLHELAVADHGPLDVSSISQTLIEDEYQSSRDQMGPLIGAALLVIAVLVFIFLRSISDLLLTLAGLLLSVIWVLGAEGWLGPDGLALIGPPSGLSVIIPIIVISLTVDYAIQTVSHYREQRLRAASALEAVRAGLRIVLVPLTLAAVTTIVSFLAGLLSPIAAVGDFGIVAGLGVGLSLFVILTLLPAARLILERRRGTAADDAPNQPRQLAEALPGIGQAAEALGRSITRRPAPYIIAIAAASIALGVAATDIEAQFSIRDVLPRGGELLEDLDAVEAAVGGSTQLVNVLIKAEATDMRTLLNLRDLRLAFEDPQRRPAAAVGPLEGSYEQLILDWVDDSGAPGDRYDAGLASLFADARTTLGLDPSRMQAVLDELERVDPSLAQRLADNSRGVDSILVQFQAHSLDADRTKRIQADIEALWHGDDDAVTAASDSIISVAVTDEIASRQTESIATTIVVALIILTLFFWITLRQPVLALIAVAPIVLALLWVLGAMTLLGIPYTLITSMITALSIGIGVDYTIHVIHRYREEFTRLRNPERAAIRTLATTGSALLGSALTTALGIGVLILSPVPAMQEFGVTAAISIASALIVATILVPPAMTIWGAYQNTRLRSNLERMWNELDEALTDGT